MESIFLQDNFINRSQIVEYNNKNYKIVTSKYQYNKNNPVADSCVVSSVEYKVYNFSGDEITKCIVKYIKANKDFIDYCKNKIYIAEVPNIFVELASINTAKQFRNNGYASMLLNYVFNDCINTSNCLNQNLKMIILRQNNPATYPLYAKFNARENFGKLKFYAYTPLIIDKLKKLQKYNVKVIQTNKILQNEM